ncbi:tyrosine kinase receptor Cad96Ca-like [Glandiceps talaboti]
MIAIAGRGLPVIVIVLPVLSTFLILAIVVVAVIFVYRRKADNKKTTKGDESESRPYVDVHLDDLATPVSTTPYEGLRFDECNPSEERQLGEDNYGFDVDEPTTEMSFNDLTILGNISVGLFTKMVKAKIPLQGIGQVTVCAKLLKDNLNDEAKNCLRAEIDFVKNLPRHPQLATMMRYSVNENPVFSVLEYFPYGSLKSYLRETRDNYKTDSDGNLGNSVDLLLMALQVARGMAFLEENELVLRMLSARSLQVGYNKVCKISEFSFCTSVMDHPTYERITANRLPIRWMALEAITDCFYSSKTDIWSYGIVLWEILNLGNDPYPEMTVKDVLYELQQGYRMPKPSHCSVQMYSLMADCWDEDPSERPSFIEITNRIENEIIDLNDTS